MHSHVERGDEKLIRGASYFPYLALKGRYVENTSELKLSIYHK